MTIESGFEDLRKGLEAATEMFSFSRCFVSLLAAVLCHVANSNPNPPPQKIYV